MTSIVSPAQDGQGRRRRRAAMVVAGATLLFVVLAGFIALFGFLLIDQRNRDWRQAEISARNLSAAASRDILKSFENADRTLMAVRELLISSADFRFDPQRRRALLGDTASATGLGEIYVLDTAGNVVLRSETYPAAPANMADDPLFYTHAGKKPDALFIAPMVTRSWSGDSVVMISRRLAGADGRFTGVVAFSFRLSGFEPLFQSLDPGTNGAIDLYGADGTLLLRTPAMPETIGQNDVASPIFWKLSASSAPFAAIAPVDGVERLFSASRIGALPILVAVALSVEEIYGGWKKLVVITSLAFSGLAGCVILLSVLLVIELKRRRRSETRYRKLAHVDGLTDLFNRRRFDTVLETAFAHASRVKAPLSVVMIDVDRFKLFNDLYGHQSGDDCLRLIAQTIKAQLKRPSDMAARYGGEEIALILPDTDEAGAAAVAESVRAAIEALAIPHAGGDTGLVTASLGTATGRPTPAGSPSGLVAKADEALYGAKRSGRNRVVAGEALRTGIAAPIPVNETIRVSRVKTMLANLSPADRLALDRITRMAAQAFGTKSALVTLVDTGDQIFVGKTGMAMGGSSRDLSFCAHALGGTEAIVILDASRDVRFAGNALVTGEPYIRFYAGAPLCDRETGAVLGTLCIVDPAPRAAFSDSQRELLAGFAALALDQLYSATLPGPTVSTLQTRASA